MTNAEARALEAKEKMEVGSSAEQTTPCPVFTPLVDILETDHELTLLADMPGVNSDGVNIDLNENILTLSGDVKPPEGKNEIDLIDLIYSIVDKGEFRHNGSNTIFKAITTSNERIYELIEKDETEKTLLTPLFVEVKEPKFTIFGSEIVLGPLRFTLTYPKLIVINNTNEIKGNKKIKLMGTEKSEIVVNKI